MRGKYSRVEDPVDRVGIGFRHLLFGIGPARLNLGNETVLVLLGTFLNLLASGGEVLLELSRVPAVVWSQNFVIPVVFDEIFQVLSICWGGIGNVMIREPSFQLGLMPLIVSCRRVSTFLL